MHVPVEVYLNSSYEPDAEYVGGVIVERPMGEYDHSSWQHAIEFWFARYAKEWGIRVRPELRIQVSAGNFRVPDVTILDRSLPIEQVITHPPIAVFEILSPEDSMTRTLEKLADYERMGIGAIWVIEPKQRHYFRYRDGQLSPCAVFELPGSAFSVPLAEIAALAD